MIALRKAMEINPGRLARIAKALRPLLWRRKVVVADLTPWQRMLFLSMTRVK